MEVGSPGGVGVGGNGDVEENGNRVTVKTVVDELAIEGRGEKVVAGIESAYFQGEIVVEQCLDEMEFVQFDRLRSKHLLGGKLVADFVSREAGSCPPYGGAEKFKICEAGFCEVDID